MNKKSFDFKNLIGFNIYTIILVLVVFVGGVGLTYAYYAFSYEEDSVIVGNVIAIDVDLEVDLVVGSNDVMVPLLDDALSNALNGVGSTNGACVDNVGNLSCQVYKLTLINNGSRVKHINGSIELYAKDGEGNVYNNLKWRELTTTTTVKSGSVVNGMEESFLVTDLTMESKTEKVWYIAVWISETDGDQRETDKGDFGGTVTFLAEGASILQKNEHGFYYDKRYIGFFELEGQSYQVGMMFNSNSGLEMFLNDEGVTYPMELLSFSDNNVYLDGQLIGNFSDDGHVFYVVSGDEKVSCYLEEEDGIIPFTLTAGNYYMAGIQRTGDVVIPETFTYDGVNYKVVAIGDGAFSGIDLDTTEQTECVNLTSVTLPDSIIDIGKGAFLYSGLSIINIPYGVINIASNAFSKSKLSSINIPNSVISIGDGAFSDCTNLDVLVIPGSVNKLGNSIIGDGGVNIIVFQDGIETVTGNLVNVLSVILYLPSTLKEFGAISGRGYCYIKYRGIKYTNKDDLFTALRANNVTILTDNIKFPDANSAWCQSIDVDIDY